MVPRFSGVERWLLTLLFATRFLSHNYEVAIVRYLGFQHTKKKVNILDSYDLKSCRLNILSFVLMTISLFLISTYANAVPLGFIDVTDSPYNADPTGKLD